jgi:hypothetical protein
VVGGVGRVFGVRIKVPGHGAVAVVNINNAVRLIHSRLGSSSCGSGSGSSISSSSGSSGFVTTMLCSERECL